MRSYKQNNSRDITESILKSNTKYMGQSAITARCRLAPTITRGKPIGEEQGSLTKPIGKPHPHRHHWNPTSASNELGRKVKENACQKTNPAQAKSISRQHYPNHHLVHTDPVSPTRNISLDAPQRPISSSTIDWRRYTENGDGFQFAMLYWHCFQKSNYL